MSMSNWMTDAPNKLTLRCAMASAVGATDAIAKSEKKSLAPAPIAALHRDGCLVFDMEVARQSDGAFSDKKRFRVARLC